MINENSETMLTTSLDRMIKILTNVVSKDETRYHLGFLRITANKEGATLEATDGVMLAQARVIDEALSKMGVAYINRDQLPFLKALRQSLKRQSAFIVAVSDGVLSIQGKIITSPKEDAGRFPDVQRFIPNIENPTFEIGLNPKLLYDLVESMKESKSHNAKLIFKDNLSAIDVRVGQSRGVLMPCRI